MCIYATLKGASLLPVVCTFKALLSKLIKGMWTYGP